jgi:CRISPR/Cas system-associated exonuclease Cas4 (RecB family)
LRAAVADETAMGKRSSDLALDEEFEMRVQGMHETLFELSRLEVLDEAPADSKSVSVTGLVTYAQCPKRFFWSEVDRLPRRRNPAAVAGTELHRRIELHQRGQVPFEQLQPELYDAVDEAAGSGGYKAFLESRYGTETPDLVEAPFVVTLGNGYQVRGRIDAVYRNQGNWEIVDFKSGRPKDEPSRMVQLQAYAVAATNAEFGVSRPEEIEVTFAYLGGGLTVHTERADPPWRQRAEQELERLTDAIDDGQFQATPGDWCHHCDFLRFCEPGKQEVGQN